MPQQQLSLITERRRVRVLPDFAPETCGPLELNLSVSQYLIDGLDQRASDDELLALYGIMRFNLAEDGPPSRSGFFMTFNDLKTGYYKSWSWYDAATDKWWSPSRGGHPGIRLNTEYITSWAGIVVDAGRTRRTLLLSTAGQEAVPA